MLLGNDHLATLAQASGDEFDAGLAVALAEQSAASYLPPQRYDTEGRRAGFQQSVSFYSGRVQLAISHTPEALVIAARGSNQPTDWLSNFHAWPAKWGRGGLAPESVHAGFLSQTETIMPDVVEYITTWLPEVPEKVYVTGHSLGGALAVLIAADLVHRGINPSAVYTFSAPRLAKGGWVEVYEQQRYPPVYRASHLWRGELDVVTRLPPRCMGWRHVGRPVVVYEPEVGARARIHQGERPWKAARSKSRNILPWWRPISRYIRGRRAHDMTALLGALRSYLGGLTPPEEGRQAARDLDEASI